MMFIEIVCYFICPIHYSVDVCFTLTLHGNSLDHLKWHYEPLRINGMFKVESKQDSSLKKKIN